MNFNAWIDSDYFWLYAILAVWFSIAAVYSQTTILNHEIVGK